MKDKGVQLTVTFGVGSHKEALALATALQSVCYSGSKDQTAAYLLTSALDGVPIISTSSK